MYHFLRTDTTPPSLTLTNRKATPSSLWLQRPHLHWGWQVQRPHPYHWDWQVQRLRPPSLRLTGTEPTPPSRWLTLGEAEPSSLGLTGIETTPPSLRLTDREVSPFVSLFVFYMTGILLMLFIIPVHFIKWCPRESTTKHIVDSLHLLARPLVDIFLDP